MLLENCFVIENKMRSMNYADGINKVASAMMLDLEMTKNRNAYYKTYTENDFTYYLCSDNAYSELTDQSNGVGYFDPEEDVIYINAKYVDDKDSLIATLMHETEHAIDMKDYFESGGEKNLFFNYNSFSESSDEELNKSVSDILYYLFDNSEKNAHAYEMVTNTEVMKNTYQRIAKSIDYVEKSQVNESNIGLWMSLSNTYTKENESTPERVKKNFVVKAKRLFDEWKKVIEKKRMYFKMKQN